MAYHISLRFPQIAKYTYSIHSVVYCIRCTPNLASVVPVACRRSLLPTKVSAADEDLRLRSVRTPLGTMSDNNRGRRAQSGSSVVLTAALAAVGALAGAAAVEHANARQENRESIVDNVVRWFTDDLLGVDYPSGAGGPSGRRRARRLSRAEINALPTRIYGEPGPGAAGEATTGDGTMTTAGSEASPASERDEKCFCAICQDTFAARDHVMRLPCFHEYHVDCLADFLAVSEQPRCPICRHPVILS